jgi:hypothetical protein
VIKNASVSNTVSWIPLTYIFLRQINSITKEQNVPDLINGYMKFAVIYSLGALEGFPKITLIITMSVGWEQLNSH